MGPLAGYVNVCGVVSCACMCVCDGLGVGIASVFRHTSDTCWGIGQELSSHRCRDQRPVAHCTGTLLRCLWDCRGVDGSCTVNYFIVLWAAFNCYDLMSLEVETNCMDCRSRAVYQCNGSTSPSSFQIGPSLSPTTLSSGLLDCAAVHGAPCCGRKEPNATMHRMLPSSLQTQVAGFVRKGVGYAHVWNE